MSSRGELEMRIIFDFARIAKTKLVTLGHKKWRRSDWGHCSSFNGLPKMQRIGRY